MAKRKAPKKRVFNSDCPDCRKESASGPPQIVHCKWCGEILECPGGCNVAEVDALRLEPDEENEEL